MNTIREFPEVPRISEDLALLLPRAWVSSLVGGTRIPSVDRRAKHTQTKTLKFPGKRLKLNEKQISFLNVRGANTIVRNSQNQRNSRDK